MSTQFVPSNQPLQPIFDLSNLQPAAVEMLIPKMQPRYQRPVLSKLIDQLGQGATQRRNTNQKFTIFRQPNDYRAATIQTRTSSGSNLTLALTGAGVNAFTKDLLVVSSTGCIAEVVSANSGTVVLRFYANPNGNTSFASTDFAQGQLVSSRGTLGDQNSREVAPTPFSMPQSYVNYISQWDAKAIITFNDANTETWVTSPYGKFYAMQKEVQAMQYMMVEYNAAMYSDMPAVANNNKPMGASPINQIKTMGGLAIPISGTITLAAFRDAARQYIAKGGFVGDEVVIICGSQYLGDLQEGGLDAYVLTAGTNNVVGGSKVMGLNIFEYGFQGLRFKFIVDPFLDNQLIWDTDPSTGFSRRSRTAIWMSTDRVKTENGGDLPFVCDYYFGNTSDIVRQIVPGMINERGLYITQGANGKKECEINFSLNKTTQIMNPAAGLTHGF